MNNELDTLINNLCAAAIDQYRLPALSEETQVVLGEAIEALEAYVANRDKLERAVKRLARAIVNEQENAFTPTCVFCGAIQEGIDDEHYHDCDYTFALSVLNGED